MDACIFYDIKEWNIICEEDDFFGLLDFEYSINKFPKKRFKGHMKLERDGYYLGSYWRNTWFFENEKFFQEMLQNTILKKEKESIYSMGKVPNTFFDLEREDFEIKEMDISCVSENKYQCIFEIPLFHQSGIFVPAAKHEVCFKVKYEEEEIQEVYVHYTYKHNLGSDRGKIKFIMDENMKKSFFIKKLENVIQENMKQTGNKTEANK